MIRIALIAVILAVGSIAVAVLTEVPGYGRRSRGTFAVQQLSRMMLCAMGIRMISRGAPRSGASLVVANHVSWIDVVVLTAAGPMVPVVRDDAANWALIGPLLSRVGALFIRTNRYRDLPPAVEQITAALRRGHRVQVFPAGSRRTGGALNPFQRALFQAAVDAAVVVSPVAVSYRGAGGRSVGATSRSGTRLVMEDDLAGGPPNRPSPARQMALGCRALWRTLRSGPMTVQVDWLPVIPALAGPGHPVEHRAAVARRAERAIARALGQPEPQRWVARPTAGQAATGQPLRVATALTLAPALAGVPLIDPPLIDPPLVGTPLVGTWSFSVAEVPKVA